MRILSERYPGSIVFCDCGALLAYHLEDIHCDKFIFCPICKTQITIPLQVNYDGMKEEKKNDEHSN